MYVPRKAAYIFTKKKKPTNSKRAVVRTKSIAGYQKDKTEYHFYGQIL